MFLQSLFSFGPLVSKMMVTYYNEDRQKVLAISHMAHWTTQAKNEIIILSYTLYNSQTHFLLKFLQLEILQFCEANTLYIEKHFINVQVGHS